MVSASTPTIAEVINQLATLIKTHRFSRTTTIQAWERLSVSFAFIVTEDHFYQQHSNEMIVFAQEIHRLQQTKRSPTAEAELTTIICNMLETLKQYKQDFPQIGRELRCPSLS